MTRREMMVAGAAGALMGCRSVPGAACGESTVPGSGVWLRIGGEDVLKRLDGVAEDAAFRVASISKLAVAETARRLAAEGRIDLDADVSELIPGDLRHPAYPDAPITLTRLLAHLSGVVDPARYWVAAPGSIAEVLGPKTFDPLAKPGRFFRYANLNYGLAATAMEAATGERFDRLASAYALTPLGVEAGFNWSGVPEADKRRGATLYRDVSGGAACPEWEAQIDSAADLQTPGPSVLKADGYDLSAYVPGTNGTLFSPQGGLRTSFAGLMAMGRQWLLSPGMAEPLWDAARDPGDTADGHFVAFGRGHYIYPPDRSPIPGVGLVGHAGEAYGFFGGLWAAPDHDAVFAFGTLGSPEAGVPMNGGSPNLRVTNAACFDAVAPYLR